jgi:hypothetical protein
MMTATTIDDRTIDAIDELAEGWDEGNWTAAHDELAKLAGYVDEAGEYDVHMVERDSTIVCYSLRGRVALAFSRGGSNWTWIATEET